MFFWGHPTADRLERLRLAAGHVAMSYAQPGMTGLSQPPPGYKVDRNRTVLGRGETTLALAREAICRGAMMQLGWVEPIWPDRPARQGDMVGILAHAGGGIWTSNFCRILERSDEPLRISLAYGTVAGHLECGEERFTALLNPADDTVTYEIYALSRPARRLSRLGYPYMRHCQKRFARDSMKRMHAIARGGALPSTARAIGLAGTP